MQFVVENREESLEKGRKARQDMLNDWCPSCLSEIVLQRLLEIEKINNINHSEL